MIDMHKLYIKLIKKICTEFNFDETCRILDQHIGLFVEIKDITSILNLDQKICTNM